ncbi:endoglucanase A precursor [Pseudomassariella vexata]|uniref:Endoglucanase A n=1 Tax=Pseudomassariella vexata TaxID=1141098 RepID=A0A1Y2DLA7_9PEZI|nr:endoglucanase A precursor [Pseudomassariella vexata]ORY59949.1 endoglucanase A precursor [Pseudomassariella vexata]
MKFSLLATAASLAGLGLATPTPTIEKRASTYCGQWDSATTGAYIVYNNLWGEAAATSGSQCTTLTGLSGSSLVWSTSWTWAGGPYNVKSYANVVTSIASKQLSAISKLPSTWKWSYTGTSIIANVAYDLFTSSSASGNAEYEIMIWLAALGGAGPISSSGSAIATVTIEGVSWSLYKGVNGQMTVFSFVASSQQTSFSGDINSFVKYLTGNQGMPTSQYLLSAGAGTEPFTGSNAVLKTSAYSFSLS